MKKNRVVILDLGTNTFHLLIAERNGNGRIRILEKKKEFVMTGTGLDSGGNFLPNTRKRIFLAIRKFQRLIKEYGTEKIFAYATAGFRGAKNRGSVVREIYNKFSIDVKIISGDEEARLIAKGIRYGLNGWLRNNVLMMDIGGSSVGFVVGDQQRDKYLRSVNAGVSFLCNLFMRSDPMRSEDIVSCENYVKRKLRPVFAGIRRYSPTKLIGSSGTFETYADMIRGGVSESREPFTYTKEEFYKLYRKIITSDRNERLALRGMHPRRADMIVTGSILIHVVLSSFSIQTITTSFFALKEGILAEAFSRCNDE